MILNKNTISAINVAINDAFNQGGTGYADKGLYQQIAFSTRSTSQTEQYGWLASVPSIREWVGDRHLGNLAQYALQVGNKKFEATVHLLRDEIEDDSYAMKVPMATALGEEVERHKNEMVFKLLGHGFTSLAYDGQPFFNANHPVTNAAGGTTLLSNLQAGAGSPWYLMDLSSSVYRPIVFQTRREFALREMLGEQDEQVFMRDEFRWGVDGRCGAGLALWQKAFASQAPLNSTNFDLAVQAMGTYIREGGGPAGGRPTHLVCGYSNAAAAKQLLETQLIAQAVGTGGAAVTNYNFGAVKLIVTPYLP